VLLDAAGADDAVIPERFTPSLTDIVSRTGLGRGTVADRLNDLERGGWVKRDRPSVAEARGGAKTRYALSIGDPKACAVPKEKAVSSSASSSPGAGLVREEDQSGSRTSPGAGLELVREPDQASPGAGRGVVREPDGKDTHQLPPLTHQDPPERQAAHVAEPTLPIDVADSKPKRSLKPGSDADPDWVKFWSAYPKKAAKVGARKSWEKALKIATAADIIAGAERYRDDPNRSPQFTRDPTTWLNNGCWDDEPMAGRGGHRPYQDPDPADYYGEI